MTWANRFRLLGGLMVVLLVTGACTLVFTQRQGAVVSTSAQVEAVSYDVGTDYGGTVQSVNVEVGDEVEAGDVLFEIDSARLRRDIAEDYLDSAQRERVSKDRDYLVLATVDGVVASLETQPGAYVRDNSILASVYDTGSVEVVADFAMTRRDFGRLVPGAPVTLLLPDESEVTGVVETIEVATVQGEALATVVVTSDDLLQGAWDGLILPGAPVQAEVQLRDDGILAGPRDTLLDFLREIGVG